MPQVPLVSVADVALDDAAASASRPEPASVPSVERQRDGEARVPRAAGERRRVWPVGAVDVVGDGERRGRGAGRRRWSAVTVCEPEAASCRSRCSGRGTGWSCRRRRRSCRRRVGEVELAGSRTGRRSRCASTVKRAVFEPCGRCSRASCRRRTERRRRLGERQARRARRRSCRPSRRRVAPRRRRSCCRRCRRP